MNYPAVVAALRDRCPMFGGRVAGAAEWGKARDEGFLDVPAAYVVPEDLETDGDGAQTGVWQRMTERVGVVVVLENSTDLANDRRGQASSENLDGVMRQIYAALAGWRPPVMPDDAQPTRGARGFWLAGGDYLDSDRVRFLYRWTYALDVQFSDADGWQAPVESLEQVDVTDPNSGLEALITVPQS